MMGLAQYQLDVPITKGASGILALSPENARPAKNLRVSAAAAA